jgi:hypothetical protein
MDEPDDCDSSGQSMPGLDFFLLLLLFPKFGCWRLGINAND